MGVAYRSEQSDWRENGEDREVQVEAGEKQSSVALISKSCDFRKQMHGDPTRDRQRGESCVRREGRVNFSPFETNAGQTF
jgi:hypothetical protein